MFSSCLTVLQQKTSCLFVRQEVFRSQSHVSALNVDQANRPAQKTGRFARQESFVETIDDQTFRKVFINLAQFSPCSS
jgi:hypothetical protein